MGVRRPHVAGNSMGGAIALELALREFAASVTAFSPAGFWSTLERRYCQLSLGALARTPSALRPAVLRLARSGNGRRVVFAQLMAAPTRVPAGEAVSALEDAWGAPSFTAALDGFGSYAFCGPGAMPPDVPITIAWGKRDWLLPFRLQAPRARQRLPSAEHLTLGTGHLPYFDDPAAVAQTIRRTAARSNRASSGTPREVTASQPTVTASAPPVHQRG
jgi:pimeloyl-ACP methyl ester carboxylesterase